MFEYEIGALNIFSYLLLILKESADWNHFLRSSYPRFWTLACCPMPSGAPPGTARSLKVSS